MRYFLAGFFISLIVSLLMRQYAHAAELTRPCSELKTLAQLEQRLDQLRPVQLRARANFPVLAHSESSQNNALALGSAALTKMCQADQVLLDSADESRGLFDIGDARPMSFAQKCALYKDAKANARQLLGRLRDTTKGSDELIENALSAIESAERATARTLGHARMPGLLRTNLRREHGQLFAENSVFADLKARLLASRARHSRADGVIHGWVEGYRAKIEEFCPRATDRRENCGNCDRNDASVMSAY